MTVFPVLAQKCCHEVRHTGRGACFRPGCSESCSFRAASPPTAPVEFPAARLLHRASRRVGPVQTLKITSPALVCHVTVGSALVVFVSSVGLLHPQPLFNVILKVRPPPSPGTRWGGEGRGMMFPSPSLLPPSCGGCGAGYTQGPSGARQQVCCAQRSPLDG